MPSDFVERQETQFVRPFMAAVEKLGLRRPILLQLIVTDQMLRDERYRADLLNWVTSFPELSGVYLIYHVHNRRKQIDDIDFLISVLQFCRALKQADLRVVVGIPTRKRFSSPVLRSTPSRWSLRESEDVQHNSLRERRRTHDAGRMPEYTYHGFFNGLSTHTWCYSSRGSEH